MLRSTAIYAFGALLVAAVPTWVQDFGVYTSVFVGLITAVTVLYKHASSLARHAKSEIIEDAREAMAPELNKLADTLTRLVERMDDVELALNQVDEALEAQRNPGG